jgi:hypothetical protein
MQLQAALDEVGRFWASALDEFKQFAESQP